MDLQEIEQKYIEGEFDECLSLIDKKFMYLRNRSMATGISINYSAKMLHSCNRNKYCDCCTLGSYLIALAHHQKELNIQQFLESQFIYEPNIRLPFELFTQWVQLEIYRKNFETASNLIRNYIFKSTRLEQENTNSQEQENFKGYFGGFNRGGSILGSGQLGIGGASREGDLPLTKDQFYELLELLVFYVILPDKGFQQTTREIKDLPMPQNTRKAFDQRLIDIRNTVVADVKLTNQEKIMIKGEKQPEQSSEENKQNQQLNQDERGNGSAEHDPSNQKHRLINSKRFKQIMIILALIAGGYTSIRLGWVQSFIRRLLKTRIVRLLLLLLFNYKYNKQ